MKSFFYFLLFLGFFVIERSLAGISIAGIPPPLGVAFLLFWFLKLSFPSRLWIGFLAGLLYDATGILPFGTQTALFMIGAFAAEFLREIFSNAKMPSVSSIVFGMLLAAYFLFLVPVSFVFGNLYGLPSFWSVPSLVSLGAGALFWTFLLGCGTFLVLSVIKK